MKPFTIFVCKNLVQKKISRDRYSPVKIVDPKISAIFVSRRSRPFYEKTKRATEISFGTNLHNRFSCN